MKKAVVFILALSVLFCTGCSFIAGITEIMQPPKLTEEQDKIYNALISRVGESINLKYPRSGDYRSAFVLYDIDNDEQDEALVFYENTSAAAAENSVKMDVLDSMDDVWKSVCSYEFEATDIDIINFLINEDKTETSIVVGYLTGLSEKRAQVLKYQGEQGLLSAYQTQYTSLNFTDVDFDINNELLVFYNNAVSEVSTLTILKDIDGSFTEKGTVSMEPSTTEIVNVKRERTKNGALLYIDTLKTTNLLATELIQVENTIRNLNYNDSVNNISETQRTSGIYSMDIDDDGKIEIPASSVLPGYEAMNKEDQLNAIQWMNYDNGKMTRRYYSYYNLSDGYVFTYPERWLGQVTVRIDEATNEAVFCKYEGNSIDKMTELMRIKSITSGREEIPDVDYQYISTHEKKEYYVKLSSDINESLVLTVTEVNFNLHSF